MTQPELILTDLAIGRQSILVEHITTKVSEGALIVLTGANGTGKSTLLKTLAGLIPPLNGHISIAGRDTRDLNQKDMSKMLAFASTNRVNEDYITVEDMIAFGRYPYSRRIWQDKDADTFVREAMQMMKIEHLGHKYLNNISDGEWQKANVCRALAQATQVILMDEPTAFLDHPSKTQFFADLKSIALEKQKIILVSTHDIELASRFGTLFWHLDHGAFKISGNSFTL